MSNVIEFYVPKNFRSSRKWVPEQQLGKVIEFCLLAKNEPVLGILSSR